MYSNTNYFAFMQKLMVSQILAWVSAIVIILKVTCKLISSKDFFKKFEDGEALDVKVNGVSFELIPTVTVVDHVAEPTIEDLLKEVREGVGVN